MDTPKWQTKRWRRLVMEDDEAAEFEGKLKNANNRIYKAITNAADPLAVFFHADREALKRRVEEVTDEREHHWRKRKQVETHAAGLQHQVHNLLGQLNLLQEEADRLRSQVDEYDQVGNYLRQYAMHLEDKVVDHVIDKKIEREAFHFDHFGPEGRTFTIHTGDQVATSSDGIDWQFVELPETDVESISDDEILWEH